MKNSCSACGHINFESKIIILNQGYRGKVNWQRCLNCKSYFMAEPYDRASEAKYTANETFWGQEDGGKSLNKFKERMYNSITVQIKKKLPPPAHLLDIGCSYGGFLFKMKEHGYHVEGFDIVPNAVEFVKSKGIKASIAFSIRDYDKSCEKKYDIISVLDSNCYWSEQQVELKEIYNRINYNGMLVLRVVDKSKYFTLGKLVENYFPKLGKKLMSVSVNDHRFSMPLNSLLKLLKSLGFQVSYVSAKDAIHGYSTRRLVKLLFILGGVIRLLTGINLSPGVVILAKKESAA